MTVAPEKLDVDGVGGARLESIAGKASFEESGFLRMFVEIVEVKVSLLRSRQYLIALKAQQSSVPYAEKASMFRFCLKQIGD